VTQRIDTERKQLIELRRRAPALDALAEQIPVERFEMTEIKDETVTLSDGPLEHSRRRNQMEQGVGSAPCFDETRQQKTPGRSRMDCADHDRFAAMD
jgi:hypothetical protein